MKDVPRDLIVQGIRDLYERNKNYGSWPNGMPDSFVQLRDLLGWEDDPMWVLVVESWLKERALGLVVELEERVDKLEMDIESLTDR